MRAGDLRYQVNLEQKGLARSSSGAPQDVWSTIAIVWAGFTTLTGQEVLTANKVVAEATTKITIRYLPGVVPEMRINFFDRRINSSRIFDILAVTDAEERHRMLELLCREHDIKPGVVLTSPITPPSIVLPWGRKNLTGAIDGVNTVFKLPSNPDPTILQVIRNGAVLTSPVDFTLNGNQVTFILPPKPASGGDPADIIFAYY